MVRIALAAAALLHGTAAGKCPTLEVQQDFNVEEYMRASWYVQKQQVNGYQPMERLNCVVATYNETVKGEHLKEALRVPFFTKSRTVAAFNDANEGGKNQHVTYNFTDPDFKRGYFSTLCVREVNKHESAKLKVAPCLLPNFLAGDYWVAAAGPSPDRYEWAIVAAGQPSVQLEDGCTTPDTCSGPAQSKCGLWFFTRAPVPDWFTMQALEDAARQKGLSMQKLVDVDQSDCQYDGYFVKPDRAASVSPAATIV